MVKNLGDAVLKSEAANTRSKTKETNNSYAKHQLHEYSYTGPSFELIANRIMLSRFNLLPSLRSVVSMRNQNRNVFCPSIQHSLIAPTGILTNFAGEFNNDSNATSITSRSFKSISWRKRSIAIKNRLRQAEQRYRKPGQIQAVSMPLSPQEMDNNMLVILSQMGKSLLVYSSIFFDSISIVYSLASCQI